MKFWGEAHTRNLTPVGVTLLAIALPVASQTIDTNRPGFTFAPTVVPHQKLQFEGGIGYDKYSDSVSAPRAELRYGAARGVELFVSSLNWDDGDRADLAMGTKLAIDTLSNTTQMALLLQVSAPTGDSNISSDRWDPSAAFIWAHSGALSLAGTARVTQLGNGVQFDNGLKLILPSPDRRAAFVEWELNWREGGDAAHWLNGGYQWLLSDRFQLDVNAGLGLNDEAGDYRVGLGLSRLF
ncbi:transporter [Congregibacter variabilis]|uniref:Transporter n=1 Tax=Congregibacter variabilis TaxID=3081200 RepID=A0ABZ0I165_9GAMM|nr:transporter [Congregibacter sp. IMCC43200]